MLILALLLSLGGSAQAATPQGAGYVVRVGSNSIYLDLGAGSGAKIGEAFRVYTQGPELIHPVTGRDLGPIKNFVADGRITDVEPLYSRGSVSDSSAPVAAGMRAELEPSNDASFEAGAPQTQAAGASHALRRARWKSPWLDFPITALAIGDFSGAGPQIALASDKSVYLYPYPPADAKPLARFKIPGPSSRIVSLETGSSQGAEPERLLVTFYADALDRMETDVLSVSRGAWTRTQDFPWMVRAYQTPEGSRELAAEQLLDDETFPFSAIYPLTRAEGRYAEADKPLRGLGSDWLYAFTQAKLDGESAALSLLGTHRLRAKTADQKWESSKSYGQTPVRLRWQGRLLEFPPHIPVAYAGGKTSVFLVSNQSRFGALAEAFGIFQSARIERATWRDASFSTDWRAELPGYVTDLALVGGPQNPKDLVAAVSTRAGKSALWIYDP